MESTARYLTHPCSGAFVSALDIFIRACVAHIDSSVGGKKNALDGSLQCLHLLTEIHHHFVWC
jgi:hypothetical protein